MGPHFNDLLSSDQIIMLDGGMGTMLYTKGVFINNSFDAVNLSAPHLIQEIHEAYLNSGAQIIETNTFGAGFYKLRQHNLEDQLYEINLKGAQIARQAAGTNALVAGSIGPLGIKIEPLGPTSYDEVKHAFAMQITPLLDGGVDLFVLETFTDLNELRQAVDAIQNTCDLPIVACLTVDDEGNTLYGTPPELFTPQLDRLGVAAVGINCSVGPKTILDVIQTMQNYTDKPLLAMPNAGAPRIYHDRTIYLCSPEYMASYARKFIKAGVKLLGGCCGTTPEHIREMSRSVKAMQPTRPHSTQTLIKRDLSCPEHITPVATADKSRFARKICSGELVISVELTPPKSCDPTDIIAKARLLHARGIDAINIPDSPRASARMSNQVMAILIESKVGIEPIPHYCCRDRNLLGMQADLLGLYAANIKNILLVTGDPPKLGDYPDATAVFDVDSIGLTNMVYALNHGMDLGRNPMKTATGYFIGVAANPCAVDMEREIKRFRYKVEAGAEYAITQPVFDTEAFRRFLAAIEGHRIPIVAGIWPLTSFRNAEFMNNEVPGVVIPDAIMARMAAADARGEARQEGVKIAQEMILELRDVIHGVQVSAPFGRIESVLEVVSVVGR